MPGRPSFNVPKNMKYEDVLKEVLKSLNQANASLDPESDLDKAGDYMYSIYPEIAGQGSGSSNKSLKVLAKTINDFVYSLSLIEGDISGGRGVTSKIKELQVAIVQLQEVKKMIVNIVPKL